MKEVKLSRGELLDLVWTNTISSLAKKYNLTKQSIRTKCKNHDIPLPPTGHWTKIKFGKEVPAQPPLPAFEGEDEVVVCCQKENGEFYDPNEPLVNTIAREIEEDPEYPTVVPKRLTDPDLLIKSTKDCLIHQRETSFDRYPGLRRTYRGELDINVTKDKIPQALRIMDTFIKLARSRGHEIRQRYEQTQVVLGEIEIGISIRERYKRFYKQREMGSQRYEPTGILVFRREVFYRNFKEYTDKKKPLEEQLAMILAEIEVKAAQEKIEKEENDEWHRQYEEQKRLEEEARKRKAKEIKRFKKLKSEAKRWNQANIIRKYIAYIESQTDEVNKKEWIAWAKAKADWFDPSVGSVDEVLGKYGDC